MQAWKITRGATIGNTFEAYVGIDAIGFLRQKNVEAINDSRSQLFFQRVCCTRKPLNWCGTFVAQRAVDW